MSFHYCYILEAGEIDIQCGEDKQETDDNQEQDEFPHPFQPYAVGNLGDTQAADKHSRCRCQHVGEAVAELEGKHDSLTRNGGEVGKLCHDGHCESRLS